MRAAAVSLAFVPAVSPAVAAVAVAYARTRGFSADALIRNGTCRAKFFQVHEGKSPKSDPRLDEDSFVAAPLHCMVGCTSCRSWCVFDAIDFPDPERVKELIRDGTFRRAESDFLGPVTVKFPHLIRMRISLAVATISRSAAIPVHDRRKVRARGGTTCGCFHTSPYRPS